MVWDHQWRTKFWSSLNVWRPKQKMRGIWSSSLRFHLTVPHRVSPTFKIFQERSHEIVHLLENKPCRVESLHAPRRKPLWAQANKSIYKKLGHHCLTHPGILQNITQPFANRNQMWLHLPRCLTVCSGKKMSEFRDHGGQVGTNTEHDGPTDWPADLQCISQGSNIVSNTCETKLQIMLSSYCFNFFVPKM